MRFVNISAKLLTILLFHNMSHRMNPVRCIKINFAHKVPQSARHAHYFMSLVQKIKVDGLEPNLTVMGPLG